MERGSVLSIARVRPDQRQQQKEEAPLEADAAAKPHDDISLDTTSTKSPRGVNATSASGNTAITHQAPTATRSITQLIEGDKIQET